MLATFVLARELGESGGSGERCKPEPQSEAKEQGHEFESQHDS